MPRPWSRRQPDTTRQRSHAGGYCQRCMAVSASYPLLQATCSMLLALLANPVCDMLCEVFQVFAPEDSYATFRAKITAHLGFQFFSCFLCRAAYQSGACLVATHLPGTHIGLEQFLLQKSFETFALALGRACECKTLVATYRSH